MQVWLTKGTKKWYILSGRERVECFLRKWRDVPFVSGAMAIINILVFLWCTTGGDMIYNVGMMDVWHTLIEGEYYRIITAMFLHADINHLINNMLLVFFLGSMIEKEIGHIMYGVTYFLSGIGGNILSLIYKIYMGRDVFSLGASGAAFGLDGVLLTLILFSGRKPVDVTPVRLVAVMAFSLYSGFASANTDNAAHVGGLTVGLVLGVIISVVIRYKDNRRIGA